jgi:hypothetical protein
LGKRRANSSAWRQWVVARRPSSSPAAASANAPVQIETLRPGASRSAASTGSGSSRSGSSKPGTTIVQASASASRPRCAITSKPTLVRTGPGCRPHSTAV